jgi:DNA-binding beta-propeller fold protein YncE
MSDYVTGLRRDLVEAAERQAQRGRAGRVWRPLHPRAWSPTALAGAAAVAAAVVAVVVTLTTLAPPPKPSDAKIVATVHLGGQPRDAALAGGSLWIADFEGRVLRLDPVTRRVRATIPVGGEPRAVAADRGVVWVMSTDATHDGSSRAHLFKLDARSGRILARVPVNGSGGAMAVGAGGLWLCPNEHRGDVERIDPDSFERTAFLPFAGGEGVSVSGRSVWTRNRQFVLESDALTGRVVSRVHGVAPTKDLESQRTLLADRDGAWVVGQEDGSLSRIEGGRIVQRIAVGATAGVAARAGSTLWVSATRGSDGGNEVVRVDPDDGKVLQRVDFNFNVPQTLVPVGKDLWVITSGGEAKLVSPE